MKRLPSLVWVLLFLALCYLFFAHGVTLLTHHLTGIPAPLPASIIQIYMALVTLSVAFYLTSQEERWQAFLRPLVAFLLQNEDSSPLLRRARQVILFTFPFAFGAVGFLQSSTHLQPPLESSAVHFNLPARYIHLKNPLPWSAENIEAGGKLYLRHCAVCHGDAADGNGIHARAWQPRPANFRDTGTIAQLDENYLYWRIQEGAPGLPPGSLGYRSVMPAWKGILSPTQTWKVIMFVYTHAGVTPSKRK